MGRGTRLTLALLFQSKCCRSSCWYFIAGIKPGCGERRENVANAKHLPLTDAQTSRDPAVVL